MGYKAGVYHKKLLDMPEGGHAIKIVGWGVEPPKHKWNKPTKYWLCANSWTDKWGMDGFFKIKRGTNLGSVPCPASGLRADIFVIVQFVSVARKKDARIMMSSKANHHW